MRARGIVCLALLGYVGFNLVNLWTLGFLANLPFVPTTIDGGTSGGVAAILIDLALVGLFGLQHSIMARQGVKTRMRRVVPAAAERAVYVIASNLLLALILALWQPLPGTLWHLEGTARIAMWVVYGLGWAFAVAATQAIDAWELVGMRQAWHALRDRASQPPRLQQPLLYTVVRHPMQLGLLIAFWATPDMTHGHALFAVAFTLYILVGIRFEERDLERQFGDDYRAYRRRVPMLLPWPRPRIGVTHGVN
jgi:protein-S-isoprenylcysteine O-methyltransferase Ste14